MNIFIFGMPFVLMGLALVVGSFYSETVRPKRFLGVMLMVVSIATIALFSLMKTKEDIESISPKNSLVNDNNKYDNIRYFLLNDSSLYFDNALKVNVNRTLYYQRSRNINNTFLKLGLNEVGIDYPFLCTISKYSPSFQSTFMDVRQSSLKTLEDFNNHGIKYKIKFVGKIVKEKDYRYTFIKYSGVKQAEIVFDCTMYLYEVGDIVYIINFRYTSNDNGIGKSFESNILNSISFE